MTLKDKAVSATLWSGAENLPSPSATVRNSYYTSAMLTPEEFGTIALLYLFVGLASAFVDSGFASALIQRQDVTHTMRRLFFGSIKRW
jgi:O-antigen/teichoic acid export membrane protein